MGWSTLTIVDLWPFFFLWKYSFNKVHITKYHHLSICPVKKAENNYISISQSDTLQRKSCSHCSNNKFFKNLILTTSQNSSLQSIDLNPPGNIPCICALASCTHTYSWSFYSHYGCIHTIWYSSFYVTWFNQVFFISYIIFIAIILSISLEYIILVYHS